MLEATIANSCVTKRDGRVVSFERELIARAIQKAFSADRYGDPQRSLDATTLAEIEEIVDKVIADFSNQTSDVQQIGVEQIQDMVERELMRQQHYSVARRYILYREEHARMRQLRAEETLDSTEPFPPIMVQRGELLENLDSGRLRDQLHSACSGLDDVCSSEELIEDVERQFFDRITPKEIAKAMVLAARMRIETDPSYDTVAGRLVLNIIYRESLGEAATGQRLAELYHSVFARFVQVGIEAGRLTPQLRIFDLAQLADAIVPERDSLLPYLGLQTIYDRYLLHVDDRRIEAPQYFWMRVAMGLALGETSERTERAIEFYNLLSTLRFTSATPTLFNSGTCHPQLSSCYLSTVIDDLEHIFKVISDNARLSKWAGGLGNDWTNVRTTNAHINGTNGKSQGVIPFLKVVSDTAVAVNQGGKRKGAVCSYLETWHADIEEFLDLRRNTGDDRRRTHDMHTANWIPDLFLKRVIADESWTLFSPDQVPDLHDAYGQRFEQRYLHYEQLAANGKISLARTVSAKALWRKMLSRLFEAGHPWITFKDPSNIRSPQDHVGVVHSSNLCTEILLNTSRDETAVCNLGSINLLAHINNGQLDLPMLQETVRIAVRMLDNVVDINYYPTPESENANKQHRPIGLGLMGFQDALAACGIGYASQEAVDFADRSMEAISYFAILASSELACERGSYPTYSGSKWDRGLLPIDTIDLLERERGCRVEMDRSSSMDWSKVRQSIAAVGMRNSNVMAIAPTATISTIIGVTQSIEPMYKHLFVKSNLSGDFVQINVHLVNELKQRGLWNAEMCEKIKYYDGSLGEIDDLPDDIKGRFATSFEIDPRWLIECASRRQKWIDMGQSLNLYIDKPSGRALDEMFKLAWRKGLKTTYYLRSLGATQVEKSTVDINKFGMQPRWMKNKSASADIAVVRDEAKIKPSGASSPSPKSCSLTDPDCEACQ